MMSYAKEVKDKTNKNIEMLLINININKLSFQLKFQSKYHLKQDPRFMNIK